MCSDLEECELAGGAWEGALLVDLAYPWLTSLLLPVVLLSAVRLDLGVAGGGISAGASFTIAGGLSAIGISSLVFVPVE